MVYKARQVQLDRTVAVKMLEVVENAEALARFEREAAALNLLKHRNIVLFYGYGIWHQAPYMVMEYLEGVSLQQVLCHNVPLGVDRSISIVQQICDGLACAHANGVVHRDLKPSNVLLPRDAEGQELVKLIDFGLAKLMPEHGRRVQKLTEAGFAIGSVLYMSPEQCTGRAVDSRSDIYAVGALLHHCLTGVPPFDGEHSVVVMHKHLNEMQPRLEQYIPHVDKLDGLQRIIDKAMCKDHELRYQTVQELMADLVLLRTGHSSEITPALRSIATIAEPDKKTRRQRSILLPIAIAAAFMFISLAVLQPFLFQPPVNQQRNSLQLYQDAMALQPNYDRRRLHILEEALERNTVDGLLRTLNVMDIHGQLGYGYASIGDNKRAQKNLSQAIELGMAANLDVSVYETQLGSALEAAGKYAKAEAAFKDILTKNAGTGYQRLEAMKSLGNCLTEEKQYEAAIAMYRKGIAHLTPEDRERIPFLLGCSRIELLQGKDAEAKTDLKRIDDCEGEQPVSSTRVSRLVQEANLLANQKNMHAADEKIAQALEILKSIHPALVMNWTLVDMANYSKALERMSMSGHADELQRAVGRFGLSQH